LGLAHSEEPKEHRVSAGKKGGRQEAPYNFEPAYERGITYLACTVPRFMARVGHELRPELLSLPECRLALEAAQSIFRERGQSPTNYAVVLQAVAAKRDDGKISQEQVRSVAGFFDTYDDKPLPLADEFEAGALKVVKARLRFAIAQAGVDEHNSEEWTKTKELQAREARLGKGQEGIGIIATPANAFAAMRRFRELQRVPFGIDILDESFGLGVPRGTLTCFMAGPGGSKSMTMSHITGQLSLRGMQACYATLELPSEQVLARVLANQTGVTIDEVAGGLCDEDVKARLGPNVPPIIQFFEPHITTVAIIEQWVADIEAQTGKPIDVLIVDYADKLSVNGKPDEKGQYQEMRIVYEQLRGVCDRRKIMGVTASQSKARDEKKSKVIDLEHTADSIHKARIVDQFITLNLDDSTKDMTFFLAKNRYGEGRKLVGPVPTSFACGQVAPVARAVPPSIITHIAPTQNTPLVAPWLSKAVAGAGGPEGGNGELPL
jgi:KaiC/GvpD/RAD55 family RecA-like ATPase